MVRVWGEFNTNNEIFGLNNLRNLLNIKYCVEVVK